MIKSSVVPTSYMFERVEDYDEIIKTYCQLGISSIRINCTRFTKKEYESHIKFIRQAFSKYNKKVNIMLDIPFPGDKMRIEFGGSKDYFQFTEGYKYFINKNKDKMDDSKNLYIENSEFYVYAKKNDEILLGDGEVKLEIIDVNDNGVLAIALNSGRVIYRKALYINNKFFAKKSIEFFKSYYIEFLKIIKPESLVFSFVESSEELKHLKDILLRSNIKSEIIAKIETTVGISNISDIQKYADGIMIGRGDLGITCKEKKFAIECVRAYKYCMENKIRTILATDILNSINKNCHMPNRAELMDVYYAKRYDINEFVASSQISYNKDAIKRFHKMVNM